MFAIYKKELRSYFINAIGYVYVGVFLAASALMLCATTLKVNSYDTSSYFQLLIFSFIILIPLLTMKLFSEEKKLRTEQLLLTAPVTIWGMTIGKFLAAFTIFFGSLLTSCINLFPLYSYANAERADAPYSVIHIGPSSAKIIGCLIGVTLIGAAFIAIGMFVSSLTENQFIAAFGTMTLIIPFLFANSLNTYINNIVVREILSGISITSRYASFSAGVFDWAALVYYVSLCGTFLFLTVRVLERRRWA